MITIYWHAPIHTLEWRMSCAESFNHSIKTTIMHVWAVDGQLHIFSIWDKCNCQGREGMGNTITHGVSEPNDTTHKVPKMKCDS